ncbi:MAG: AAA family ATPase [Desulfuromonadales bacterium]
MNAPELDYITVKGFKSIASAEKLGLRPINVIIGANGSGKSNLVALFRFLQHIRSGHLQDYAGKIGADNLLHFGPKTTPRLSLELGFTGVERISYALELEPGHAVELLPVSETVTHVTDGKTVKEQLVRNGREAGISGDGLQGTAKWIAGRIQLWRLYHLHDTGDTSPLRRAADLEDNRSLRADAGNLPAFLYLLQQRHPVSYSLLRRTVQLVAPFFDDFILRPSELNPDRIKLEWRHRESDAYFDAWALSDGTLRFIALAAIFMQPVELRPRLIVVDEPELGLHPLAINLLGSMIRMAAVDSQIVLATQSSHLLDEFTPEDVLVVERSRHTTTFQRLDGVRLESWLEDYSLGELWEKNEFGGRPGSCRD